MSRTPAASSARVPLRDLFQQEQQANGGNPAAAFIAILDEMDRRMTGLSGAVETNSGAFRDLMEWHRQVTGLLNNLPEEVEGHTEKALRRLQPVLERAVEGRSRQGALEGTNAAQPAIEMLREAARSYEDRKKRLARIGTYGLPAGFGVAMAFGFLFGSWGISALPASWQWPCQIIGAEHYANPDNGAAFCLIQKK